MIRILAYILPIMINFISGGTFFITAQRFSEADAGEFLTGLTLVVWAVTYMFFSFVAGRITTQKNAPKLIVAGALSISFVSLCFLIFDGLYMQYCWLALMGVSFSLYCTPFQVFSKSIESGTRSEKAISAETAVAHSAGFYTASWSLGMAVGPFCFGVLSEKTGFIINIVLGFLIALMVCCIHGLQKKQSDNPTQSAVKVNTEETRFDRAEPAKRQNLVAVGWLIGGFGTLAIKIISVMIPICCVKMALTRADSGIMMAVLYIIQSCAAFGLAFSKNWMYRILHLSLMTALGIGALLLFGFSASVIPYYAAALIYGLFSAGSYFLLVFHSLIHPNPATAAKYVSMNEIVVGAANIQGPVLGGFAVKLGGSSEYAFYFAAMALFVSGVLSAGLIRCGIGKEN